MIYFGKFQSSFSIATLETGTCEVTSFLKVHINSLFAYDVSIYT